MNLRFHLLIFGTLVAASISAGFAQGSLTPPATISPNMKTLAQVEPRTPISLSGITIINPGSYYLTTNLVAASGNNGIVIAASNVRFDLNGFSITTSANPASGYGIYLNGNQTNIVILNGIIRGGVTNNGATVYAGPGFTGGIASGGAINVRVDNVQVSGATYYGISLGLGTSSLVRNCIVSDVGSVGISADLVLGCFVDSGGYGGSYGIQCGTASHCQSRCYNGTAIAASQNAVSCSASSQLGTGINAVIAADCQGMSSNSTAVSTSIANNCSGTSTSGTGIFTSVGRNSTGATTSGSYGLYTGFLATGCSGYGGSGIYSSHSLISCVGSSTSAANKYNMP